MELIDLSNIQSSALLKLIISKVDKFFIEAIVKYVCKYSSLISVVVTEAMALRQYSG